jgi:hypothetical protein
MLRRKAIARIGLFDAVVKLTLYSRSLYGALCRLTAVILEDIVPRRGD